MFTNATNKFRSLVMNSLADVGGFKICIQTCVWLGFPALSPYILKTKGIAKSSVWKQCFKAIEHTYTTFYKTITYHNDLSFSSSPISCQSVCVHTENERDRKVLCLKNKNKTIKYVEQNKK